MSSNLTEVTGGGAIFPANIVGPDDGDPAVAESAREGMRALANRTQYLAQLGSKQVVNLLTAASIPVDAGNLDALTEAVQALIADIATKQSNHVLVSNALVVNATGTTIANALYVVPAAGGHAGILASSTGNQAGITGYTDGSYTNKYAPCGIYGLGYGQATGVYGTSVSTGIGGVFEGGASAGDALHAKTRGGFGSGAIAIVAECNSDTGRAIKASTTNLYAECVAEFSAVSGVDTDILRVNGRINFPGGTINPSSAKKNTLYALNTVKAFATLRYNGSAFVVQEGYGISSAVKEGTNNAVCTVTMEHAMQTTAYSVIVTSSTGTGVGFVTYVVASNSTSFPRTTTAFSVIKCDETGAGSNFAANDELFVLVMGKQS